MAEQAAPATIDEYLRSHSPEVRKIMQSIRMAIIAAVPGAQETISYKMPAFKLERTFFYFAAFKQHVGVYPPLRGSASLDKSLLPYRGEKGNLRFPLSQPMPLALISRVAKALAQQYSNLPSAARPSRAKATRRIERKS